MPTNKKRPQISPYERGFERGRRQGSLQGFEYGINLVLMVLMDKHDAPRDDLRQLFKEINSYSEMIGKGNVNFDQLKKTLYEEYGISFKWRND